MPKRIPVTNLRVSDVLGTPAAVRETVVHTVGPAVVIVLEQEAPARTVSTAWSEPEFRALLAWVGSDPEANTILRAYVDSRASEDGGEDHLRVERERLHELRLSQATTSARVAA
jgi:hypothetical protein